MNFLNFLEMLIQPANIEVPFPSDVHVKVELNHLDENVRVKRFID